MTVLPDFHITQLCESGRSRAALIDPFNLEQVSPASYDVRLGQDFKVFERNETPYIDMADPVDITKDVHIKHDGGFLLHPGEFILGSTVERVNIPDNIVSRIEGKSSIGRLGLMVHVTAGYIDPGFKGKVTLEMANLHPLPLMLHPGMLVAQLSFHYMSKPADNPYRGRYQDADSVQASRYGQVT